MMQDTHLVNQPPSAPNDDPTTAKYLAMFPPDQFDYLIVQLTDFGWQALTASNKPQGSRAPEAQAWARLTDTDVAIITVISMQPKPIDAYNIVRQLRRTLSQYRHMAPDAACGSFAHIMSIRPAMLSVHHTVKRIPYLYTR